MLGGSLPPLAIFVVVVDGVGELKFSLLFGISVFKIYTRNKNINLFTIAYQIHFINPFNKFNRFDYHCDNVYYHRVNKI